MAEEAAAFIRSQLSNPVPNIAVICGSGLGGFADTLRGPVRIATADIPYFPHSTVVGHAGQFVIGSTSHDLPIIAVQGRVHVYEGHPVAQTAFVVRVLKHLGVKTLMVTNAAGGINRDYGVGDLMVISDHLNLPGMAGVSPLVGANNPEEGPRFVPTNNAYPHRLRHLFFKAVDELKLARPVHEGVYAYLVGPTYESAAEVRALRSLGADVVGMSTVPEVIAAVHMDIDVFGLSLVTNKSISTPPRAGRLTPEPGPVTEPTHAEVVDEAAKAAADVQRLIEEFVRLVVASSC